VDRRQGFALVLHAAFIVLLGADATAQEIRLTRKPCDAEVHLSVRGARFSDVLKRLSDALGFTLQFEATGDSIVDIDMTRRAPELVARLSPSDNVIVTQGPDPQCPGQDRIVKVWVLPKTGATASAAPAAPPPRAAAPPDNTPHYDPARVDEMSRKAKAMYDEYVRIHGVPPPTPEEEAAK